jgi:hypothetical protein
LFFFHSPGLFREITTLSYLNPETYTPYHSTFSPACLCTLEDNRDIDKFVNELGAKIRNKWRIFRKSLTQ